MTLSRRHALAGLAGIAGTAGATALVSADPLPAHAVGSHPTTLAVSPDPALHLMRRATYGPTPALAAEIGRMGWKPWLEQQFRPGTIKDAQFDGLQDRWPILRLNTWQMREKHRFAWDAMYALREQHLARACWSRRQLLEVMVDVWSNQLNVTLPSSEVWDNRHLYDRDVIRKNALGTFEDMLLASAQHPAMLRYLDGSSSTKLKPNENYGRELLELHTVGLGSHYTETDVRDSARILTGLSVDNDSGAFHYKVQDHYVGRVKVLGFVHHNATAEGGLAVAQAYLRYLARHPLTAQRIAQRLCVRFVADTPPPALVRALAKTYLTGGTAIVPVLRQLFTSPAFWASRGQKVKTPLEDLIATVRLLALNPDRKGTKGIQALGWMTEQLGQPPMGWHPPDGYPDISPAWASTTATLARWNIHMNLANNSWPKELVHPPAARWLPSPLPTTHGALVEGINAKLLLPPLPPAHRNAICKFLEKRPADPLQPGDAALGWRLGYIVALLLDTPQAAVR